MRSRRTSGLTGATIYMALFSARFTEVFWVVYLRQKGMSFAGIGLMETIFHIVAFSSEMPTGIIADRWGRKTSLAVGRLLAASSAAITLFSGNLSWIAVAFAFNAVSYTCHSGAFEALVHDSLIGGHCDSLDSDGARAHGSDGGFSQVLGNLNAVYLAGASVAGALASVASIRFPIGSLYAVSIGIDLIATAVALGLPEDVTARRITKKATGIWDGFRRDVTDLSASLKKPVLRRLLLLSGVAPALATSVHFYGQPLLQEALVPLWIVGMAGTLGNLFAILPTKYAYLTERRYGQIRPAVWSGMSIPLVVGLLVLIPGQAGWGWRAVLIALYLGLTVANETFYPLQSQAINARTESHNRASVLSSSGMLFSVWMMIIFPLIGFIGDRAGLRWGMAASAGLTIVALASICVGLGQDDARQT